MAHFTVCRTAVFYVALEQSSLIRAEYHSVNGEFQHLQLVSDQKMGHTHTHTLKVKS